MDDILKKFQSYVQPILDFKIEVGDGVITPYSIFLSLVLLSFSTPFPKSSNASSPSTWLPASAWRNPPSS